VLITVGPLAAEIGARFRGAGPGGAGEVHRAADPAEAAALLESLVRPGDLVLVKGSRAVGLERVCDALKNVNPPARATV
ncbi:MAG TPA: UDP-N-acetylmuramoyl-tripeptide--D-alanyl-D-alanine ligase, partial [Candidatus Limnocylindria bacterium]|nr:UDP-N-acetylmuramoyl-tripeptide--D-alanyl-D-alanine ligase [Candidatus Limnocylindria bacterium]